MIICLTLKVGKKTRNNERLQPLTTELIALMKLMKKQIKMRIIKQIHKKGTPKR